MQIYGPESWVDGWDEEPSWTQVIDLRPCENSTDLMRACASVLHGVHSSMGGMEYEPNLNWMQDIAYDWFVENWGTEKKILIVGGNRLFDVSPRFALSYVDSIESAFQNAILEHCQKKGDSQEVVKEIFDTRITLILN